MLAAVQIRVADAADVPALADLAARTWRDQFGDSLGADDLELELASNRSPAYFTTALGRHVVLVAQLGNALVGYAEIGPVDIPGVVADAGDAQLHRLYVDRPLQRLGIGRDLLNSALAHPFLSSARRVFLVVWEENARALHLYESMGFVRIGTTPYAIGTKQIGEDLVMCLERSPDERGAGLEVVRTTQM